ncbi:MAG TPA: hypothetical protein PLE61_15160 [Vicinamibacterales bacterium]|nr:hypothetical protein [Vicinamibacterales bacterium]HPW22138.1 hypothetical protein [Vicinamibacterales bacterium]
MAARQAQKKRAAPPPAPVKPRWLVYLLGWLVPGGAHLWLGRPRTGVVFLVLLPFMFALGLAFEGRLFPFDVAEPLTALAAVADVAVGLPYFIAKALGFGAGRVLAVTFEYGNAFLITAGLINVLVVVDAHDVALGRK